MFRLLGRDAYIKWKRFAALNYADDNRVQWCPLPVGCVRRACALPFSRSRRRIAIMASFRRTHRRETFFVSRAMYVLRAYGVMRAYGVTLPLPQPMRTAALSLSPVQTGLAHVRAPVKSPWCVLG